MTNPTIHPAPVKEVQPGEVFHVPGMKTQMEFVKLFPGQGYNAVNTATWATAFIDPNKIVDVMGIATSQEYDP
jgi:hypothetical protein